jgi:hypothetical protein
MTKVQDAMVIFALIALVFLLVTGCQTLTSFLPPQPCQVSPDLPVEKHLVALPEVETGNQTLFGQFLTERKVHAQDDQDYNSLYKTCVLGGDNGGPVK